MAAKYHINSKGEAGRCRAQADNCPFGGELEHYSTADDARSAYEKVMSSGGQWHVISKDSPKSPMAEKLAELIEEENLRKLYEAGKIHPSDISWMTPRQMEITLKLVKLTGSKYDWDSSLEEFESQLNEAIDRGESSTSTYGGAAVPTDQFGDPVADIFSDYNK